MTEPCGTTAAYRRHLYLNEPTCDACRQANNEAFKAASYASGKHRPNKQPVCGTVSGYNRHYYTDTVPCRACRDAHAEYQRNRRTDLAKRRRRGSWRDVVVDYLGTHGPMSMKELHYLITLRHDDLGMSTLQKTMRRLVNESVVDMRMVHTNDKAFGQGIYSYD